MRLLMPIHSSARLADSFLILPLNASFGASSFPMARMNSSVLSTIVLTLMARIELTPLVICAALLRMEMRFSPWKRKSPAPY